MASVKTLTNKLIESPLLPDKMYKINGEFYDRNFRFINKSELKKRLFLTQKEKYFLKSDNSSQGRGVIEVNYKNFNLNLLRKLDNFVIQEAIQQHDFFNEVISDNVSTIRITTVKVEDKTEARASYVRVGRSDSPIVQPKSLLRVPIINKKGDLGDFALNSEWKRHYEHPDTNYIFENKRIPNFEKATKAVENIHMKFPHFSLIGWDVAINIDGEPQIMEWNAGHPDIKFTEATTGPTFKDLNWEKFR